MFSVSSKIRASGNSTCKRPATHSSCLWPSPAVFPQWLLCGLSSRPCRQLGLFSFLLCPGSWTAFHLISPEYLPLSLGCSKHQECSIINKCLPSAKQPTCLKEGISLSSPLLPIQSGQPGRPVFSGLHGSLGNLAAIVGPLPQPCLDPKLHSPRLHGSLALVEHWGEASVRAVVGVGGLQQGVGVTEGL